MQVSTWGAPAEGKRLRFEGMPGAGGGLVEAGTGAVTAGQARPLHTGTEFVS